MIQTHLLIKPEKKIQEEKQTKQTDKQTKKTMTLARASRDASASAAIARWSCTGSFTSLISTRSTFIPQSSVASSSVHCYRSEKTGENQSAPAADRACRGCLCWGVKQRRC